MRQSNIELCRILSIILVLVVHSNFAYLGWPNSLEETNIFRLLLQGASIIGVNVFILITGYFSTYPKKKSIANLAFTIIFYGVLLLGLVWYKGNFSYKSVLFISSSNWFILDYIGLLLFCPFLNSYIENTDKKKFAIAIFSLLAYEMYFGFLPGFNEDFHNGYSILSFMIIYLIGRYIRLHGISWIKHPALVYIACTILLGFIGYLSLKYNIGMNSIKGSLWLDRKVFCYNNPIVILSSIAFFIYFINLKIKPSKLINHISKSCLAILLIHTSKGVSPYLKDYFKYNATIEPVFLQILTYIVGIIAIFTTCIIIDQIRLYILKKINLNK